MKNIFFINFFYKFHNLFINLFILFNWENILKLFKIYIQYKFC